MKKIFLFLTLYCLFLFNNSSLFAQTDSLLSLINDLSENETYLADLLLDLQENPVNLNESNKDQLLQLPLISTQMADSIIASRQRIGRFRSKRQIRVIIGPQVYDLIKNYISASQKRSYNFHLTQRNIYKIEKIPEIESGKFKGDALNNYMRLKYQVSKNGTIGVITQKDTGERNYLDHFNFNMHYQGRQWNVLLGNFFLQLAQGLSHSSPYGNKKSIYLSAVFRKAARLARPNLTGMESAGKFGLFLQNKTTRQLIIFAFYSSILRDAQLTNTYVTGFKYDGFHRSRSELNSKNRLRETNWGAGINYKLSDAIQFTTFFNDYRYSRKISQSEEIIGMARKRRQYFNFSGTKLSQAGAAYIWQLKNFKIAAEMSASNKGKPGWIQSIYYSKDKLHIGLKYWYLNNSFQSIDGRGFDSSDPFPQGSLGFFSAITLNLNNENTLSAFKKYEHKLWRSYFDPMPVNKNEWLLQWDLILKPVQFVARFRSRQNEIFSTDNKLVQRNIVTQKSIRLQLSFRPEKRLGSRVRWERVFIDPTSESGTLFFKELDYMLAPGLSLNTRFTFYNTSSFDSRIYEYERDLPGAFANLALFGGGHKFYVLLKCKFAANFSLWFKWRYISKEITYPNGESGIVLSRDLRLQIQTRL